ncbi:hypothetical protein [Dyadobacter bucti]|uniref:hypothetical protein n=1 Tax=Dyadobacter bucti TaxID=2572203 RepID=UPI003F70B3FC
MRFYKDPVMQGCTDFVATDIPGIQPFSCIRVIYWDDYGYRGIEGSQFFEDSNATEITEAEFYDALHAAHFGLIGMLGGPDAVQKLNEANTRATTNQTGTAP